MNHLEFAAMESAALVPGSWERWAREVEKKLGHSLDGDQAADGYSMDPAFDAWRAGASPDAHVAFTLPNMAIELKEQ